MSPKKGQEDDHKGGGPPSHNVSFPREPPIGEASVTSDSSSQQQQGQGQQQLRRRKPPKFRNVAQMIMNMNRQPANNLLDNDQPGTSTSERNSNSNNNNECYNQQSAASNNHRRGYSTSQVPYGERSTENSSGPFQRVELPGMFVPSDANRATSNFMDHAQHLEQLFATGSTDSFEDLPGYYRHYGQRGEYETLSQDDDDDEVGSDISPVSSPDQDAAVGSRRRRRPSRLSADIEDPGRDVETGRRSTYTSRHNRPRRMRLWHVLMMTLQPGEIARNVQYFISTTVLLFMAPAIMLAAIMFYLLENPDLQFLPSRAKLPWFLLFAVRLSVTFTLAQISQWCLQLLTMRTSIFARLAGPLLALVAMQSMGWPCLLSFWGLWNLIILHGESVFVKHWLWFTGIKLFSIEYNTGDGFLASNLYGRILCAMILSGLAAATKRTFVALYLSRRMLHHYRSQLEQVMRQVKLVIEVAELAAETAQPGFDQMLASANQVALETKKSSRLMETVPTFSPAQQHNDMSALDGDDDLDDDDDDDETENSEGNSIQQSLAGTESSDPKVQWSMLKTRAMNDRDTMNVSGDGSTAGGSSSKNPKGHRRGTARASSRGLSMIFPFLERWQEPEDKGRTKQQPTLHDILQFKKAMAFMETEYPFALAFGSVRNRKSCVKNAVRVYRRLQQFTPEKSILSFDVIGALAYEEDGEIDEDRAVALLRVFLPDKDDNLSLLAFVQSIDYVYKQLRFLRASLSNSSKIDSVLEDIFNIAFYAILFVVILSVLGFDPWPLLVSFSTLTVSFAFAFGPSVAKNVEGILMIAVRRPYDIGDRITICSAETVTTPTPVDTWLVEDISLTTTTLRYASTNEVATINNASIANARIVNCARSLKASITFRMRFSLDATQKQIDEFRMRIESYMEDRPRIWVGLIHYRMEQTDSDNGFVSWMFRAQHNKAWQELGSVMIHKGELEKYGHSLATDIGINYETPPRQLAVGINIDKSTTVKSRNGNDFIRSLSGGDGGARFESRSPDEQVYGAISEYFDAGVPSGPRDSAADGNGGAD